MAGYALGMVISVRLAVEQRPVWMWLALFALVLLGSAALQSATAPDSPAALAAVHSRYYWFLAQWHWFEWMGLVAPAVLLAALSHWGSNWMTAEARALCRAAIAFAILAALVALFFAQEDFRAHTVARMQPLRAFLLIYAVMALLCGASLAQLSAIWAGRARSRWSRLAATLLAPSIVTVAAVLMFRVQRATFPASIHIESPGRENPNPWAEAFVWARDHTPENTLFALDARYINTAGEDAQTFRAIAQRSAIPDFSKDGGEAATSPGLAPQWQRAAAATADLSHLSDAARDAKLAPFGVQWAVLHASAPTQHACPYANAAVKVCRVGR